ncbi:hypothetical protein JTY60_00435 [symbiont of Argiope bruennichi]|uniref:hypothetical protein n=1 Tax=symbiont of Argiope bruennichi TaxID=2810479 RepID=UPI003DA5F388
MNVLEKKPIKTENIKEKYYLNCCFYTKKEVAKLCWDYVLKNLFKKKSIDEYLFIEPSAGEGCFFDLLPKNKIGIDLEPIRKEYLITDYLKYEIPLNKNIVVIGNHLLEKEEILL